MPGLLLDRVQLLRYGSSAAHDLQVQLPEVLVQQRHRDVLGAHVRRVSRAWHLPKRKQTSRLLFLYPEYVHLDMPELGDALPLNNPDRRASVHAHAGPHLRASEIIEQCKIPSASMDARTTAYSSDYPLDFAMTACVFE